MINKATHMNQSEVKRMEDWNLGLGSKLFISGPCSVESPDQVIETARQLGPHRVDVLRGGIWKPRTRPNAFEGVGKVGLKWLKDAGNSISRPVSVEVANAAHVEQSLKAGIDILWLGARTTVSPFAVQEIANALKGVDIPVLVKNPINPDLNLWIGALERMFQAGIDRLGVIHRGFSYYGSSKYRNRPLWEIPIELKRIFGNLPIICDPSHIAGNRELIGPISQKAFDLDFDGVMIESHIDPDNALSDAKQQVTPSMYNEIVSGIVMRNEEMANHPIQKLDGLRESIDHLDNQLIDVLSKRMNVAQSIGDLKRNNDLTIFQQKRWSNILENRIRQGIQEGLSKEFMRNMMKEIHKESINHQAFVMNSMKEEVV